VTLERSQSRLGFHGTIIDAYDSTATSDGSGAYTINGLQAGVYPLTVTQSGYAAIASSITIASCSSTLTSDFTLYPPPTLTCLRVSQAQAHVAVTDGIDDPIVPSSDPNALSDALPLGLGVVADEVTPVIFRITGPAKNYTIEITHNASAYNDGTLAGHLSVLQGGQWIRTTSLSVSSFSGGCAAYIYLGGLTWAVFNGTPINGVTVNVNARSVTDGSIAATTNFLVRPPPIALVHGIADDNTAWSYDFTNTLANIRPAGFVVPVQYGVGSGTKGQNGSGWPNATWPFNKLTLWLDAALTLGFEAPLHANWAFTRYDVVGQSQGGVLLRMLCQTNSSGRGEFSNNGDPIVSPENSFRGRFRRVITIGSPHNGSLIARYIWQLGLVPGWQDQTVFQLLAEHTPMKFDPFLFQIHNINETDHPADSRIRFNCIETTIEAGHYPDSSHNPLCYRILGLADPYQGVTRGKILLPHGSDGVVDLDSQGGGAGTAVAPIAGLNIAHADIDNWYERLIYLFGVPPGHSQTTYYEVANEITNLLSEPPSSFGPFNLPILLTDPSPYDALVPRNVSQRNMITAAVANLSYTLQLPADVPTGGTVAWFAQVFGTNGLSLAGVALEVSTNNPGQVTVSVDNDIQGQVVLYASYGSTNGDLVIATPIVVLSNPPAVTLSGIQLNPSAANMSVGDILQIAVWGNYTTGWSSLLYIPAGGAQYFSSNTNVASVDANGMITMNSPGIATITASYQGFTSQTFISTIAPFITTQPQNVAAVVGSNATFSVVAVGMNPLGYQWQFNGTNLADNAQTTGSHSNVLSLSSLTMANGGTYQVVVTNLFGGLLELEWVILGGFWASQRN
jgi:hypothetical protein